MAKEEHGQDSPLSVVQEMYEAVNTRDWDTGFGLLTEDLEWHEPAQAFHTGTHRGFDEIRQRLEDQLEVFDELTIEPLEFHERGELIAVPVRQRARGEGSGVEVEIRIGHLWAVRDGRIARLDVFAARDDALRAADEAST
jgi:ketosteroid isomerase-like protein